MKIIKVALDIPVDGLFDYRLPDAEEDVVGCRVSVPFGNRNLFGIVVECAQDSTLEPGKIREASQLYRDMPPLSAELLALFRFCSRYYQHPLGMVVMNSLPQAVRSPREFALKLPKIYCLSEKGRQESISPRNKNALLVREALLAKPSLDYAAIKEISPGAITALKKMLAGQLVLQCAASAAEFHAAEGMQLKPEQQQAFDAIASSFATYRTWLLYGVTGSGKSEIYLRLAQAVLARGQQVLVLVPEINLTPQLEALFRRRFPGTIIATLHSGLSAGNRTQNWLLAQAGSAGIVLGTRLAVFAPLPQLGLIIVDEEHDQSFKQQEGLRYSARDVAVIRAKALSIPVVLGSATPSLESLHNANSGRYDLLRLTKRAIDNAALPVIKYVDTRISKCREGLSDQLLAGIAERIALGQQSLVFVNRRGYAPALSCLSCSWVASCHRCSSRLVLHLREKKLRCHYCGLEESPPLSCPDCGNLDLKPVGHGTQRIESRLVELFPGARILRIDRDSTSRRDSWNEMLLKIHGREVDILVGTQILAKGHDFPNLSLVGILNSDSAFYSTDFRATERLFSQLIQVSGRAGRAEIRGEVLIQTEFPTHPLYLSLQRHDYDAIAAMLLAERKVAGFPPFIHQALLRAEAEKIGQAFAFLEKARALAAGCDPEIIVLEPAAANMMRLSNQERAHLLIQSNSRGKLQQFLAQWRKSMQKIPASTVRWHIDVDPLEF